MDWSLYLNFLIAMLAIINPIGIWPLWSAMTDDVKKTRVRRKIAFLIVFSSILILLVFLFSGSYLLKFFSIDIPVFRIAGGVLLLLTGISMIEGSATKLNERDEKGDDEMNLAKQRFKKIVVPLIIPALAGPGSITTVILYGAYVSSLQDYLALSGVIVITFFVLFIVFESSYFLERMVEPIIFNVSTRIFGIIVTAIAVQFMVEGLGQVFPAWVD
ncbi:MAG: MarC family protein [Bacteroidales bacterium]